MREEEVKPKKPHVMHNTTAHFPLTDAHPISESDQCLPANSIPAKTGTRSVLLHI